MRETTRSNGNEAERIFVFVRVRPLSEKERARRDVSVWECISPTTIQFKSTQPESSTSVDAYYAFDKVFGGRSSTQQLYEAGIKQVALSVVSGINTSIFAYGQTSSGKTYTMGGITEYAVRDIYDYIETHQEREFILKFSAMEIYNEVVRDLLSGDNTPLRLLDDKEKGTVVDKLTEEILTGWSRLQELLSICAAERTTKETSMNETSSRSHQILRLTVESSPSGYVGAKRSGTLVASVNFVDLAGSERASQALTADTRLREGGHINRSLLTLGTVIRKLSKERNGHIPYRDSKLTRILQNSLGGNARTAIICTISPTRGHVEQSRNTLFFAGCAKQVTTNAKVNMIMSEKILVKHLQNELARMEKELRSNAPNTMLLKEREHQIEQMDKKIQELTRQRDIFQSRVENLLQTSVGSNHLSRVHKDSDPESSDVTDLDMGLRTNSTSEDPNKPGQAETFFNKQLFQQSENPEDNFLLDGNVPEFTGPDPCQGWEEIASRVDADYEYKCEEVQCIEDHKSDVNLLIPTSEDIGGKSPVDGNIPEFIEHDPCQGLEENASRVDAEYEHPCEEVQCIGLVDPEYEHNCEEVRCVDPENERNCQEVQCVDPEHEHNCEEVQCVDPEYEHNCVEVQCVEDRKADIGEKSPMRLIENGNAESVTRNVDNELIQATVDNSVDTSQEDALQQKIQALQRTIDRLLVFTDKSNGSSDQSYISPSRSSQFSRSKSCVVTSAAKSHFQFDQPNKENKLRSQSGVLDCKDILSRQPNKQEQKVVSPLHFKKLEPATPPQFDKPELKTMLPPQFDNPEEETITSPAKVEQENCPSLACFQDKLSEWDFHAKKRKVSRQHFLTHQLEALNEEESLDSDTEDTNSVLNFVVKMNRRSKTKPSEDFDDLMIRGGASDNKHRNRTRSVISLHGMPRALLPSQFEQQQRYIVELWDACNVPLAHRSYFFLLIKGEFSDAVYLDVELRRLSFLRDTFSTGTNITEDGEYLTLDSSLQALNREREMLSKKVYKRFSKKERERYYMDWGIDLKSKNRSTQLAWRLWTNTKDMHHVRESAKLVAKLIGLVEPSDASKKKLVNLLHLFKSRKSHNWKDTTSNI